ncbi:MAG: arylesterase [Proteobacteria bacterium]|nr:arylesterase [Pseudomonadota bacterium]
MPAQLKLILSLFISFIILFLNPTFVSPAYAEKQVVLILGDSLAAGFGIDKEAAFPSLVQKELNQMQMDIRIINGGISGSTSASAVGRLKWYARIKPTILLLELGANDGLRGLNLKMMKSNLKSAIMFAKKKGMQVLIAGMKMPLNYGQDYTHSFENTFINLAKEQEVPIIPFLLEGVAGNPELNQADGIHPTKKGHIIVSKTVLKYLLPILKKR